MFSPRFKAKAPQGTGGIWTPKNQTPSTSTTDLRDEKPFAPLTPLTPATPPPPPPPAQPIWTPQPSPTQGRREFRPIRFESPTLPRRYVLQPPAAGNSSNAVQPPWSSQSPASGLPPPHHQPPVSPRSATSCTNLTTPTSIESGSTNTFEFCAHDVGSGSGGYGGRPTGVSDKIRTFERSASASELSRPFRRLQDRSRPAYRPNEVIYKVQQEYMSEPETEYDKPRKMAQIRPRQYDGIGPTTNDGMPIILRSEVKAPHQHEWYKRLYQTIHKQKNGEDYVIRYKCPRGRNQYKSSGYQSEPEPSYPSSLDRRRLQTVSSSSTNVRGSNNNVYQQDDKLYGSMPNPIKSGQSSYKNQPGRIEDYVTGHSSVSEKERKEWWDEVMDIFNGHWDQQKLSPHYTEGNLSRALAKESGYTSDSNLVFRKKEVPVSSPLSPVEQKVAYKQLQAGGEPPLFGFRKPAPEKSKDHEEEQEEFHEEFECLQVTPTLTKIRVNCKAIWGKNPFGEQDHSDTEPERRSEMFTQFPKSLPTFIPLKQEKPEKAASKATTPKSTATSTIFQNKDPKEDPKKAMPSPPKPPNRKSSCSATRSSSASVPRRPASSRHHQCYQSNDDAAAGNKYGTITLRKHGEPILRSKSTGAVSALLRSCAPREPVRSNSAERMRIARLQQHIRLRSVSPSRCTQRNYPYACSSSPVAFGRSISKERTFAEEKKRLESTLPLKRSTFEASTNILRDPSLRSPQDVKKAVRSYASCSVQTRSKSLPRINKPSCSVNMQVKTRYPAALLQQLKVTTKTSTTSRPVPPKTVYGSKTITTSKSSGNLTKCVSTVSLARTNSTYSLLSTMSKEKEAVEKRAKESAKKAQKPPKSPAKSSKPETIYSSTRKAAVEEPEHQEPLSSVRDKALFWDDFNAGQKGNLKPACKYGASHHNSRSLSPMRRAFVRGDYEDQDIYEYINQNYQYAPGSEQADVWQNGQVDEYGSEQLSHSTGSLNDLDQGERGKRKFSPTREVRVPQKPRQVRSPSRRKIDSCRQMNNANRADSSSRVIRASSLSSADDRARRCANTFGGPDGGGSLYQCGELAHSATSLGGVGDRHSPTCRYRKNCERFTDLNRFYNTLERVGQLERTTSSTSFKPIRKESELLDFNEWRKVRLHERAEKELHYLVGKLKDDQRHKDVVYRAKFPEEIKWRKENDYTLTAKDKSVEDLREAFEKRRDFSFADYGDQRDLVRPYWRRNTVADLAYSLEHRQLQDMPEKSGKPEPAGDESALPPGHLSKRLVSTLSKEQIVKISKQLNEIYSNKRGENIEDYVVNVDKAAKPSVLAAAHALKVRCNSSITKNDLLKPAMKKREFVANPIAMSEASKTEEPFTGAHTAQCNLEMAKETRGAIAAKKAERTLPSRSSSPIGKNDGTNVISIQVPYTPRSQEQPEPRAPNAPPPPPPLTPAATSTTTKTQPPAVPVRKDPADAISSKIKYFEEQQFVEPPKTIYHAREDSSPDEAEVMRLIEDNMKKRAEQGFYKHKEMSSSLTEINDLFGERSSARVNFHFHSPSPDGATEQQGYRPAQPTECMHMSGATYEMDDMTPPSSMEFLNSYYRSRSLSPPLSQASSSHLCRVRTGEVQKIKEQFESLQSHDMAIPEPQQFFGERGSLRRVRSDPEVPQAVETQTQTSVEATNDTSANDGGVSWITHKFETHHKSLNGGEERSRPKLRIPQTVRKNRLMPHIDIISKRAALKKEVSRKDTGSPERSHSSNSCSGGFVERMRSQYESSLSPCSQRQCLFSSNPDIHNLTAISEHLSADWIAHKYPSPTNNTQTPGNASQDAKQSSESAASVKPPKRQKPFRANSISPPRPPKSERHRGCSKVTSTLKPYYDDIFANQHFDPKIHQPKARYVPDGEAAAEPSDPKKSSKCRSKSRGHGVGRGELSAFARKTMAVTFQDYDYAPPVPTQPPPRSYIQNGNTSEEELALRQAEQMQRLYQEERRRKYLQELQDMNSRRHTDNFTPSQKSPIPLNRYDDFPLDVTLTNGSANGPKAIARALYNFNGQNARELTLKKGDIIYIRRQIDKNWYEGEHNASIGLFPANYVEIINKDVSKRPTTASLRKPSEGQARAKYNFQAQSGVELSLNKGELVTLTRRVDENWFEGKIANRKGIFPVNYVEVLTDIGAEDIAAKTVVYEQSTVNLRPTLDMMRTNINNEFNSLTQNGNHPANSILKETKVLHKTDILHVDTSSEPITYRALYKYKPQNSDELELLEGDLVQVLEKCDDGWFVGTSQRTGCFGTFPGNYVERA